MNWRSTTKGRKTRRRRKQLVLFVAIILAAILACGDDGGNGDNDQAQLIWPVKNATPDDSWKLEEMKE